MTTDAKRRLGTSSTAPSAEGEFLSTLLARPSDKAKAVAVVVVLSALFAATAPYAKQPLPVVRGFIPIYQSALVVIELVTAVMLFGQFRYLGSRAILVLGCGYLFSAGMAVAHALSFPGLFGELGWLGAGAQTTAWLYFAWHAGFPLFLIAYSRIGERHPTIVLSIDRRRAALLWAVGAVCLTVFVLAWLVSAKADALPVLMVGNADASSKVVVATATWVLSLLALLVIWTQRRHTVLDLWCMVVAFVWIFEVALAAVLNGARFDLGFYSGRVYGLLAGSFVLCVLLLEHSRLFAQLLDAHGRERSERAAAEEKSRELSVLNQDLDAFTYSISHDLRAPLRAIEGYSAILQSEHGTKLDEDGRRMLSSVRRAATRMEQMIQGLLRLSMLGRAPLQTQATDMDHLVRERIEELCHAMAARRPEFRIGQLGTVHADETLLQNVIDNLVGNAIKYSSHCAAPVVEVGRLGGSSTSEEDIFFVRDNGAGFDMRYAEKLFGVFQRLHSPQQFEGHGIGLAVVQRVVQRHGGRVWAQSTLGEGATFYFSLRAERGGRDAKDSATARSCAPAPSLQGVR